MSRRTLMALSGGLDSTFLAHSILSQTDDELHLFRMDLSKVKLNRNGQQVSFYGEQLGAEAEATEKILLWFQTNLRPVASYRIVEVKPRGYPKEYPMGNGRSWRVFPMLQKAAEIVNEEKFDRFVYGRSPENIRSKGYAARLQFVRQWWTAHVDTAKFEMPLIDAWQGRPHAIAALPKDLRALTIACNRAELKDGIPTVCGECDKCMLNAETEKLLAQKVSPDIALDYLLRLRKAGPYIDSVLPGDRKFGAGIPAPLPAIES